MSAALEDNSPPVAATVKAANRVVGLDVARGALMAWIIILTHGIFWLYIAPADIGSMLLFEMPPIFMITGAAYFLGEGKKADGPASSPQRYFSFLLRRSIRILVPYFAYALVCALIILATRGHTPGGREIGATLAAWLNPMLGGSGHTALMLSWHLWFVTPFLTVTALMPLIARTRFGFKAPLWLIAIGAGLVVFLVQVLPIPYVAQLLTVVFYMLWALFGFALAAAPKLYGLRDYALVFVLSIAAIALAHALAPGQVSLNMQANKFPPNVIFFAFCCAWMAVFMIGVKFLDASRIAAIAGFAPLRPFIRSGYSIYLWQGLAYSGAALIGRHFGWSIYLIWPLAIVGAVVIGSLAAPLERLRLPKSRA